MGTNYYAKGGIDVLHIGKASAGWCFGLHVIPELDLNSLASWETYLREPHIFIEDEYRNAIGVLDLLAIITDRRYPPRIRNTPGYGYASWEEHDRVNDCSPGPRNCLRRNIDGRHCIGHGEGTWDLIAGEFS